jgi:hypothetical protein
MSSQEKQAIVSLITTLLITPLYSIFMAQRYPHASAYSPEVFRFWGTFLLILIPVSIVANIVIHIVFSIINTIATREEESSLSDERDKLIVLKSQRNAGFVFILGFVIAMGSLAFDQPPTVMFITLIASGMLTSIVTDVSSLYYYRKGV